MKNFIKILRPSILLILICFTTCEKDELENYGSNSMQVYGSHNGGCWSATATHLISSLPQKLQVEAYLRASGEAGTGRCGHSDIGIALMHQTESSTGYGFIDIRFRDDMNVYLSIKGEPSNNLQSFNINQWYHVKFELDAINYTITAWVDDVSYGPYSWSTSSLPYSLSEYRAVSITSDDGKGWGDNLIIIDKISNSTIYSDDFESYTSGQFPSSNWDAWHNCSSNPSNNIVTNTISYVTNI